MTITVSIPERIRAGQGFTATLRTQFTTETVWMKMVCDATPVRFSVEGGDSTEAHQVTVTTIGSVDVAHWAPSNGRALVVYLTRTRDDAERLSQDSAQVLP